MIQALLNKTDISQRVSIIRSFSTSDKIKVASTRVNSGTPIVQYIPK